jgi:dihydrofolate synthase/folylpolyglutamate synthase
MAMTLPSSYDACLTAMYRLRRFGIKLGLEVIAETLQGLGNPQERFRCIHVAGTNGKGSVSSALATILHAAGCRVGLYTSPHLVRFNERIQIDLQPISDEAAVEAYQAVARSHSKRREMTFFEYATAMAFHAFAQRKVDWAVIETGMGGRLDATNIVHPAVSIITNLSIEHKAYLGGTLTQIAAEKAGIIKPMTPVITGVHQPGALAVLRTIAQQRSAPLYRLGESFRVRRHKDGSFSYFGIKHGWHGLRTGLYGSYQVDNAALVIAACELLASVEPTIDERAIRRGLVENHWPGRLEVVSTRPFVVLDGAHNLIAARNLARFLQTRLAGRNITLVVGILDDKPYRQMLDSLLPAVQRMVITRPRIDRALAPETLEKAVVGRGVKIELYPDVESAFGHAVETADPDEVICIAGSLYVVGEAKQAIEQGKIPGLAVGG